MHVLDGVYTVTPFHGLQRLQGGYLNPRTGGDGGSRCIAKYRNDAVRE